MSADEDYAFACTHWALGSLVLVGLAASEYSGAGTIVALPIAAVAINLSVLCGKPSSTLETTTRKRRLGDAVDFLVIWIDILEHLVSVATCARVASATVDYTTGGRLRELLFGLESHSLGEPWPDVLGVTITIVITGLFIMGLEKTFSFAILLYAGVAVSFLFFVVVGGYHTDIKFWNWTEDFMLRSWGCMLTTAATCAFAFANSFPSANSPRRYAKFAVFVILPLICYSITSVIFTLMSHYRELAGTAIPLVRVFEVRDVDWARPVMAVCTISVVCVALTEVMPSFSGLLVHLARREWQVLVLSLVYESALTGAPVLAIFAAGSFSSILAFACPLTYLVRLLNISPLIKCILQTSRVLYDRFKPEFSNDTYPVLSSDIHYSKLDQEPSRPSRSSSSQKLKTILDSVPKYLKRGNNSRSQRKLQSTEANKGRKGATGDKEYLLLGDYNSPLGEGSVEYNGSSSDEENNGQNNCNDAEADDSSSSTDVDVVVQEYRERVQVSVNNFEKRTPTLKTSIAVTISILLIITSSVAVGVGILLNLPRAAWPGLAGLIISTLTILPMPQNLNERSRDIMMPRSLFPIAAIVAISLNTMLACTQVDGIWPGLLCWVCSGLLLFWRCNCCTCEGLFPSENETMTTKTRQTSTTDDATEIIQKDQYIDTILIAR